MKIYICPVCKQDARNLGCDLEGDELTGNTIAVLALHTADGSYVCDGYGCRPLIIDSQDKE